MIKTRKDFIDRFLSSYWTEGRINKVVGYGIDEDRLMEMDIPRKALLSALFGVWMTPKQVILWGCDYAERKLEEHREAEKELDDMHRCTVHQVTRHAHGRESLDYVETCWDNCNDLREKSIDSYHEVWSSVMSAVCSVRYGDPHHSLYHLVRDAKSGPDLEWKINQAFRYIKGFDLLRDLPQGDSIFKE